MQWIFIVLVIVAVAVSMAQQKKAAETAKKKPGSATGGGQPEVRPKPVQTRLAAMQSRPAPRPAPYSAQRTSAARQSARNDEARMNAAIEHQRALSVGRLDAQEYREQREQADALFRAGLIERDELSERLTALEKARR